MQFARHLIFSQNFKFPSFRTTHETPLKGQNLKENIAKSTSLEISKLPST